MCDICQVQRDYPEISTKAIERIIDAVQEKEAETLEHTLLSILRALNVTELTVTGEQAAGAAEDLECNGVHVTENVAADWGSVTYKVERNDVRPAVDDVASNESSEKPLRPLKDGEINEDNQLAALFRQLGLNF